MSLADGAVIVPDRRRDPVPRAVSAVRAGALGGLGRAAGGRWPAIAMNELNAPHIDYAGLSPLIALTAGTCVTLLRGPVPAPRRARAVGDDGAAHARDRVRALGLAVRRAEVAGRGRDALRRPRAVARLHLLSRPRRSRWCCRCASGPPCPAPASRTTPRCCWRASPAWWCWPAPPTSSRCSSGIELLSIPLYVMCALDLHRRTSLEAGLKYLVIGSVGSATLLYGLAFIYGASGSTDFDEIARAIGDAGIAGDPLLLTGIALALTGLAFKASVAPFHQWTPDVYEGAPTSGDRVHGGRDQGRGVRDPAALLRRRAAAGARTTGTWRSRRSRWSRSWSATSARSGRTRSSACSPTPASRRPATCSPASSSRASSA